LITQIAARLGSSLTTVKTYFVDPTGKKARAITLVTSASAGAAAPAPSCATARATPTRSVVSPLFTTWTATRTAAPGEDVDARQTGVSPPVELIGHIGDLCAQSPVIVRKIRTSEKERGWRNCAQVQGFLAWLLRVRALFGSVRSPVQIRAPRFICEDLQGFCGSGGGRGSGPWILGMASRRRKAFNFFEREIPAR